MYDWLYQGWKHEVFKKLGAFTSINVGKQNKLKELKSVSMWILCYIISIF